MLIHDAAGAFTAIIRAAFLWVETLAFVLSAALLALGPLAAPAVKRAARRATRPSWARGRIRARIHAHTRTRRPNGRTAPWVHTQPINHDNYREAA